jgi:hypothetical protein
MTDNLSHLEEHLRQACPHELVATASEVLELIAEVRRLRADVDIHEHNWRVTCETDRAIRDELGIKTPGENVVEAVRRLRNENVTLEESHDLACEQRDFALAMVKQGGRP